ncbi:MAG: acyl carrier protein, partial [Cyanobacteria bacterium P01_D01_bin.116]
LREENSCPVEAVKVVEKEHFAINNVSKTIAASESKQPNIEQVANWIIDWIVKKVTFGNSKIDRKKSFADYGLDSIRAVKLAEDLSNWLQREILPTVTWNFPTVDSLANHLGSQKILQVSQQVDEKKVLNAESNDLQELNDRELAELLEREIAALQQKK